MDTGQFISLGIGFGLVLASLKYAAKCRVWPTLIFGALAWVAYIVPKWLIWPVSDPRDMRILLLVGALILIGGPLVVLMVNKRKRGELQ